MSNTSYCLDRTVFKRQTAEEANYQRAYWLTKSVEERLQAAWYLTCKAYGLDPENPPRLDRTKFSMRKQGD